MKTVTRTRIITATSGVKFGYPKVDGDLWEWIVPESTDDIAEAAERLGCSPDLVQALMQFAEILTEAVVSDLRDIWKRLDAIEARL